MKKQAFTLIEVLIAIILVGLAIASLLGANIAFTRANGTGAQLSTAEFLIEQIRELTATVPVVDPVTHIGNYNELTAYNGKNYSWPIGPIDSKGNILKDSGGNSLYPGYSQRVTVQNVSASDFHTLDASSKFYRITVEVRLNNETISSAIWLRANLNP